MTTRCDMNRDDLVVMSTSSGLVRLELGCFGYEEWSVVRSFGMN